VALKGIADDALAMNIHFRPSPDQLNYLRSSARIRQVTKSELLCALIGQILDDQLVLAVMDDADKYPAPLPKPFDSARERTHRMLDDLKKGKSDARGDSGVP
jgi:hypothetical protein